MDDKNLALKFFLSKIGLKSKQYKEEDILDIQQIHHGFTNKSFLFITKDQNKFQVRLGGSNDVVNRNNEAQIIKALNDGFYLFLDKDGNAIKKWIEGDKPNFQSFNKKKLLKLLVNEIKRVHAIDISKSSIIKHDYFVFWKKAKLEEKHAKKYQELYEKYKDLPLVLSHNDINPNNMIYNKSQKRIYLIDFEWGRINNAYWDYANFFRESNLKLKYFDYLISLDNTLEVE
ncbi:MAG: phosphotransferase [Malacoplasma sp.]|nr:phosphotransferase [Malacoplasma sp.]